MEAEPIKYNLIESTARKRANNRIFWDNLVLLVWCEQKIPFENRKVEEKNDWLDIQLPSYCSTMYAQRLRDKGEYVAQITGKSCAVFRTPREVLTRKEQQVLQQYIDTHYTTDRTTFRREAKEARIFSDCTSAVFD